MNEETETGLYEACYLLKGDLGEEKALETSEFLRQSIKKNEGIITQENKPKKQNLSYPVARHNDAYFGSIKFIFPVGKIPTVKKFLEKFDLLRLIILKQLKHEREAVRRPAKRRAVRRPSVDGVKKEFLQREGVQPKEPLQVEEIDKKLKEILCQ
jgi:ribosomal protein S6